MASFTFAVFAFGSASATKPIASSSPSAVKKPLTVQQKNQMARALRESSAARKAPPKTMAEARATQKMEGGAVSIEVPVELHHYLGAQPDDTGRMRIRDINPAAPNQVSLEVSDER